LHRRDARVFLKSVREGKIIRKSRLRGNFRERNIVAENQLLCVIDTLSLNIFKKAAALDIEIIAPLHGPVLCDNLPYYLDLYNKWSSYAPEEDGVVIAYTSVYGNTKAAALALYKKLRACGKTTAIYDLARCDMSDAVAAAFRYSTLVLATTTYNGDVFPFMREFINHLTERAFKNRRLAIIENGSWAPMASKVIRAMLEKSAGIEYCENSVKISSALSTESTLQLEALAEELCS